MQARFLFILALLFLPLAEAEEGLIREAHARYFAAGDIRSLREVLGFGEGQGYRAVVRSDVGNASGWYFILEMTDAPEKARTARLEYIATDSKETRTAAWELPAGKLNKRVLYLGLTGTDWPGGKDVRPLSWKLELRDGAGTVIALYQSFLYAMP